MNQVCPTSRFGLKTNYCAVPWGPAFTGAASEVWKIKTADDVPSAKRQAFKDKNMAWRAAMSDSADDSFYIRELRHALTNIVSQHPASPEVMYSS